jgi:hypothetical protein
VSPTIVNPTKPDIIDITDVAGSATNLGKHQTRVTNIARELNREFGINPFSNRVVMVFVIDTNTPNPGKQPTNIVNFTEVLFNRLLLQHAEKALLIACVKHKKEAIISRSHDATDRLLSV